VAEKGKGGGIDFCESGAILFTAATVGGEEGRSAVSQRIEEKKRGRGGGGRCFSPLLRYYRYREVREKKGGGGLCFTELKGGKGRGRGRCESPHCPGGLKREKRGTASLISS